MKSSGLYPAVRTDTAGVAIVSQSGAVGLIDTVRVAGLDRALSQALAPWRKPMAVHDPGKILTDLAIALAIGGDCLSDIGQLRKQSSVFGPVASDPTVSRLIDTLAADADRGLAAIDAARAATRSKVWELAGEHAPNDASSIDDPVIVDLDATLITAHSDKEHAAATFKKGFGFHPLLSFVDHGQEAPVNRWRSCSARATPAPTPPPITSPSPGQHSHSYRATCPAGGRARTCWSEQMAPAPATSSSSGWSPSECSTRSGSALPSSFATQVAVLDKAAVWSPALDSDAQIRPDALVADATGLLDLTSWPQGMRVLVRKEKPHPGAQLRITDVNGWRVTAFATNTPAAGGPHRSNAHLELRHRRRARCEDRIRVSKDTGLTNLPLHDFPTCQAGVRHPGPPLGAFGSPAFVGPDRRQQCER